MKRIAISKKPNRLGLFGLFAEHKNYSLGKIKSEWRIKEWFSSKEEAKEKAISLIKSGKYTSI